ncbi:LptE family protein [candidate division WOR-3 bacterium]|nr:LptE family protein [candidate division WOR-3 bacterium]
MVLLRKICAPVLLCSCALGCTYNFSGFTKSDIKSIAIPVFENQTIKYGIEEILTRFVIDAFIQDNRLKVLERKSADSILLGKIISYKRAPFSYNENAEVKDYKIELVIKLTYKDKERKTIFEKELNEWILYSSEVTEEDGIENLCTKTSADILRGIIEGW